MSAPFEIEPDLAAALRSCRHLAVLTGAGISAESGIPTFREALTGVWSEYDPEELATPEGFARNPDRVWGWYRSRRAKIAEARPNPGHLALAELERRVPRMTLVTQNIDGLHVRAGSRDVIELHGNISRVRCSVEGDLVERFEEGERAPSCPSCGAPLRPDVIWFGELLPRAALERAWLGAESADLFLSVGTSNLVEPAASLPWAAARAGARVVVINTTSDGQRRGPGIEHLVGPAGEVLPALVRAAWPEASTLPAPDSEPA